MVNNHMKEHVLESRCQRTLAASTSFAVASANTLAAAKSRFWASESSWVSASALIPVTNEEDAWVWNKRIKS